MFKARPEVPFTFTKPIEELAPAFLADKEVLVYEAGFKQLNPDLIKVVEDFLRVHGLSQLKLVSKGAENLVFACIENQHRRRVVFKVNVLFGLRLFEQAYLKTQDTAMSLENAQRMTDFEVQRERGIWRRLRQYFPEATVLPQHIAKYEIPLPAHVMKKVWQENDFYRQVPCPALNDQTRFPIVVAQQRMTDRAKKPEDRTDFGFKVIWMRDDPQDPIHRDLHQISEETDGVLMHGKHTRKANDSLLSPLFGDAVRLRRRLAARPEELIQLQELLKRLDAYIQKTRTALDVVGGENINLAREVTADANPKWNWEFIDPFIAKRNPLVPAATLDSLTPIFAKAKAGESVKGNSERLSLLEGIGVYYLLLNLKAWCRLFDVPSTVQVQGLDEITTLDLRRLYGRVSGNLCI